MRAPLLSASRLDAVAEDPTRTRAASRLFPRHQYRFWAEVPELESTNLNMPLCCFAQAHAAAARVRAWLKQRTPFAYSVMSHMHVSMLAMAAMAQVLA